MKAFPIIVAVASALIGCAGTQQMTPEQRAAILRYTQQQQMINAQQADSLANTYTAPMRALPPQQQAQPFTCTSRMVLGTTTTDCR